MSSTRYEHEQRPLRKHSDTIITKCFDCGASIENYEGYIDNYCDDCNNDYNNAMNISSCLG